ncbi:MAG: SGNH/GDSL hydrolase family protein [Planctomycetota bacterium]
MKSLSGATRVDVTNESSTLQRKGEQVTFNPSWISGSQVGRSTNLARPLLLGCPAVCRTNWGGRVLAIVGVVALALVPTAHADSPKKKSTGPAAIALPDSIDPTLPNVLLIGDSISIGYTVAARKALAGQANVFRPPTNCGPTSKGVSELQAWLGDRKWDVIHFNFGLHDLKYMSPGGKNLADPKDPKNSKQVSPVDYAANLKRIVAGLKKTSAKLIWRETTPVPPGCAGRISGDSVFYNQVAREVMDEAGEIAVDPMHDYASEPAIADLQRTANVHYTAEGSKLLGDRVAEAVRRALGKSD